MANARWYLAFQAKTSPNEEVVEVKRAAPVAAR
jgi:hypothetical protein